MTSIIDRTDGLVDLYDETTDSILVFANDEEIDAYAEGDDITPLSVRAPSLAERGAIDAALSAL
jgi:hypothetical protein